MEYSKLSLLKMCFHFVSLIYLGWVISFDDSPTRAQTRDQGSWYVSSFLLEKCFCFSFIKISEDEVRGVVLRRSADLIGKFLPTFRSYFPVKDLSFCVYRGARDISSFLWKNCFCYSVLKGNHSFYLLQVNNFIWWFLFNFGLNFKFKEQPLRVYKDPWDISRILLEKYVFELISFLLNFEEGEVCVIKRT